MRIEDTLWCDGCGVEITWAPVVINRRHYCCKDCAEGKECDCSSEIESEDDRRTTANTVAASYEI
jgi:hypothetical protein